MTDTQRQRAAAAPCSLSSQCSVAGELREWPEGRQQPSLPPPYLTLAGGQVETLRKFDGGSNKHGAGPIKHAAKLENEVRLVWIGPGLWSECFLYFISTMPSTAIAAGSWLHWLGHLSRRGLIGAVHRLRLALRCCFCARRRRC